MLKLYCRRMCCLWSTETRKYCLRIFRNAKHKAFRYFLVAGWVHLVCVRSHEATFILQSHDIDGQARNSSRKVAQLRNPGALMMYQNNAAFVAGSFWLCDCGVVHFRVLYKSDSIMMTTLQLEKLLRQWRRPALGEMSWQIEKQRSDLSANRLRCCYISNVISKVCKNPLMSGDVIDTLYIWCQPLRHA